MPGPMPKRSDQRRRTNSTEPVEVDREPPSSVDWPAPDPNWLEPITRWYQAQQESGQASLLEPSDVATLWLWAEALDDAFKHGTVKPSLLSAWTMACRDMLVTEGSRRRASVELASGEDAEPEPGPHLASVYSRLKAG